MRDQGSDFQKKERQPTTHTLTEGPYFLLF